MTTPERSGGSPPGRSTYSTSGPSPARVTDAGAIICRVEEGGAIFGLEGARSGEQGDLLAVGAGPARLQKVPKADLLRLSLDSDWRHDVAALVDDWVDRISRAAAPGDPPGAMAFLEREVPHSSAAGRRLSARREVLWVRPGPAGIRFIDRVSVPTCPHESRFPVSPHAWISCDQAETVVACDTETLIENGDLWQGLRRFHHVVLDAIAAMLALERAQADARRSTARLRDGAIVSTALAQLCARPRDDRARPPAIPQSRSRRLSGTFLSRRAVWSAKRKGSRSRLRRLTIGTTRSGPSRAPPASARGASS